MGLEGAYDVAGSGIAEIARELAVVSRNVANANTPDYAAEVSNPTSAVADGLGMGVREAPTTRDLDTQLQAQVQQQGGLVAGLATTQTALQAIDAVQGTPGAGTDLSSLLGKLQDAFSTLGDDPSSQAQQARVVDAAGAVATQVRALSAAYATARQGAQDGIVADVATLNGNLARIGQLGTAIVQARAAGQSTADLENQRDWLTRSVTAATGARFLAQPAGGLLAVTAGGGLLPLDGSAQLVASPATTGAAASYPGGGIPAITLRGQDITGQLSGGSIGARIALRDATVPTFQAQLDQFAQTLAARFDAQGLTLFTDGAGQVPAGGGSPAQAGYVGLAATIAVNPAVAADPAAVRDGTHAVTADPAGAAAFTPNPAGGPAGFGALVARVLDYALGSQAQDGVAQPAVPVAGLGPGGTLSAGFQPPGSLAEFASTLVAAQSQASAGVTAEASDQSAVQAGLQNRLSAGSAVSVDKEMSTMVALQNAYAANARVLSAVNAMWSQLVTAIT